MFDIWLNIAQKKAPTELFIQLDKIPYRTTERHMDVFEVYIMDFLAPHLLLLVMIALTNLQLMICAHLLTLTLLEISLWRLIAGLIIFSCCGYQMTVR